MFFLSLALNFYIRCWFSGGASSAVRAQCNYLGVWPY